MPSMNAGALRALPPRWVGQGSGAVNFARQFGGALGVNLLSILLERRTQLHAQALTATQEGRGATREVLQEVERMLAQDGIAEGVRQAMAQEYLGQMLLLAGEHAGLPRHLPGGGAWPACWRWCRSRSCGAGRWGEVRRRLRYAGDMTRPDPLPALALAAAALGAARPARRLFAALQAAMQQAIGHRLFTIMRHDAAAGRNRRAHTSDAAAYPVSGFKPVTWDHPWTRRVLVEGRAWIGRGRRRYRMGLSRPREDRRHGPGQRDEPAGALGRAYARHGQPAA